jgi:hypothetical protein
MDVGMLVLTWIYPHGVINPFEITAAGGVEDRTDECTINVIRVR